MDFPITKFPHLTTLEASLNVEYPEEVFGEIEGTVPLWVKGSWYRNGPGMIHFKKQTVNHWFDGMALARKFLIEDGKVSYISKFIDGESRRKNIKAGKLVISEFGTSAVYEGFQKIMKKISVPDLTDNCLVNFMPIGKFVFAITESNLIAQVDAESLKTIKTFDISKNLPVHVMCSHPLQEAAEDIVYIFSSCIFDHGYTKYHLIKFPGAKADLSEDLTSQQVISEGKVINSIYASSRLNPSYHHSFSISKNFAVFIEMPLKLNIASLATAHMVGKTCIDCMVEIPNQQTKILLVPKQPNKTHDVTYCCEALYIWHHLNAYEEGNNLVLDVCCYNEPIFHRKYFIKDLELDPSAFAAKYSKSRPRIIRMVLPLSIPDNAKVGDNLITLPNSSCTAVLQKNQTVLCSVETIVHGTDFPVINELKRGSFYNYFYSPGGDMLPPGEKLVKVSIKDRKIIKSWQEESCWASQPVFVPEPGGKNEDQGILMSSVSNAKGKPFLLMLDAKTFCETARIYFDANIPPDIHGLYLSK